MRLWSDDVRAVNCSAFGFVTQTQRPDRLLDTDGWRVVGVYTKHGDSFMVITRRRWFWQKPRYASVKRGKLVVA